MNYEKPNMELVNNDLKDVICTSIDESWSGDNDDGFN